MLANKQVRLGPKLTKPKSNISQKYCTFKQVKQLGHFSKKNYIDLQNHGDSIEEYIHI